MESAALVRSLNHAPDATDPWAGDHKIPWNEPEFSRRMLREHLDQTHSLASRPSEAIAAQAAWILDRLPGDPGSVLDLGCGPGLYAPHLANPGRSYLGIDYGPASIEYAKENFGRSGRVDFLFADLLEADFQGPHDLALLLYGELNVFSPKNCRRILDKAFGGLAPGGTIMIEVHTEEAVLAMGSGQSWYASQAGLFSDRPHVCLTINRWLEEHRTAQQVFQVIEPDTNCLATYRSTTRAYGRDEYLSMLEETGFRDPAILEDWPAGTDALMLVTAVKP